MKNNIYLIGLGAIGMLYGSKIQENYPDSFKVIVDPERFIRYQDADFTINGASYEFNFYSADELSKPADIMIFSTKQFQLESAIETVRHLVSEKTIIASLLNGISSEDVLKAAFPYAKIIHTLCIGQDAVRIGRNLNFTRPGSIIFGSLENKTLDYEIQAFDTLLKNSAIDHKISDDILHEQWRKFMINNFLNQLSAIMDAPYGVFQSCDNARQLIRMVAEEVISVANSHGIALSIDDFNNFIPLMETLSPDGLTSMLQDMHANRQTEFEMLSGEMIARAKRHDIEVPISTFIYHLMCVKEQRRQKSLNKS